MLAPRHRPALRVFLVSSCPAHCAAQRMLLSRVAVVDVSGAFTADSIHELVWGTYDAAIISSNLEGIDPLQLAGFLRSRDATLPIAVEMVECGLDVLERTRDARVQPLMAPLREEDLRQFIGLARARRNWMLPTELLDDFCLRNEFTLAERRIAHLAAHGASRGEIARQRGVSETTVKAQIRKMLHKTGTASLSELILRAIFSDEQMAER